MLDLVAPAGSPIPVNFLIKTLFYGLNRKKVGDNLKEKIGKDYDVRRCYLLNSGRTALFLLLKAMKSIANENNREVIIPAYTCFSVPSAIVKAGLKIRLVDIDPETLDYSYSRLESADFRNGLAIIACNLFGITSDVNKLQDIAAKNQLYLIDDAAQSMGARINSKHSGTFGDAGIFSLGRGKNITAYEGGILVSNNDQIAEKIESEIDSLRKSSGLSEFKAFNRLALYSLFLRPGLYWIPAKLPFLQLGETIFDPDYDLSELSGIQQAMSAMMFAELSRLNSKRRENAIRIGRALIGTGKYEIPGFDEDDCPAYIRLPVICTDKKWRDQAISDLKKQGIIATTMYPSGIHEISGIIQHLVSDMDDYPGTRTVTNRLLTIPTHPLLKQSHIEKILSVML